MASTGAVALYHIVEVTPEAPDRGTVFRGIPPLRCATVTLNMLRTFCKGLTTTDDDQLDMIALGSPHFSLNEFALLSKHVEGKYKHERIQFLITASRVVRTLADNAGYLKAIRRFGGTATVDTCILTSPMLPNSINTLMTNSAKYAYYAPGLLGTGVVYGSLKDCVQSAMLGRVETDSSPWDM